jgi:hypothetical protein
MAIVLSPDRRERLEAPGGGADTYRIPVVEADRAAALANMHASAGLILAAICVIAGILAVFAGITTPTGQISIPLPGGDPITFDGVPTGVTLVLIGLAFFWISRPEVRRVEPGAPGA